MYKKLFLIFSKKYVKIRDYDVVFLRKNISNMLNRIVYFVNILFRSQFFFYNLLELFIINKCAMPATLTMIVFSDCLNDKEANAAIMNTG